MIASKKTFGKLLILSATAIVTAKTGHLFLDKFIPLVGGYDGYFYLNKLTATSAKGFDHENSKVWSEFHHDNFSKKYSNHNPEINKTKYSPDFLKLLNQTDKEIYKTIWDHTFKLSMPCQSGTAWILDFEIPKDGSIYPTKWFIATNLHVINNYKFDSNPFEQELPIDENFRFENYFSDSNIDKCKNSFTDRESRKLTLFREITAKEKQIVWNDSIWNDIFLNFDWSDSDFYRQIEEEVEAKYVYTADIKDPKLFYAAIDFLGPRYTKTGNIVDVPYFKDFGVLEINFESQQDAAAMTDNFYYKYYKKNGSNELLKPIDFMAPELMKNRTHSDLMNKQKIGNFYFGGYPGSQYQNLRFDINTRNSVNGLTKSYLTHSDRNQMQHITFPLLNKYGQTINGHIDLQKIDKYSDTAKVMWNNKNLHNWGYAYSLDNSFLTAGSSGSMVLDNSKKLLGLYRLYNTTYNDGFVDPIRSDGIFDGDKIISPKFDLINGTTGQISSYRQQLESYYPNLNTYLKEKEFKKNTNNA